eukprot:Skav227517  [mRNA]  locus=scaffold2269:53435:54342:- [translate_table: standard]
MALAAAPQRLERHVFLTASGLWLVGAFIVFILLLILAAAALSHWWAAPAKATAAESVDAEDAATAFMGFKNEPPVLYK